ncbi:Rep, partial [Bat circovirus]
NPVVGTTESEFVKELNLHDYDYFTFQLEQGENGTKHLQGYIEFRTRRKLDTIKKLNGRIHWERRNGTRSQAIAYCNKDDTRLLGPFMGGELPKSDQGRRSDLETIREKLNGRKPLKEIADDHFGDFVRYHRGFREYKILCGLSQRTWKTHVVVLTGKTGIGKSRYCQEHYPNAFWKRKGEWWDGYDGHESVIIDEFYGWLPIDTMLRIMDRYPLMVDTKGGAVNFEAKTICITSNKPWEKWYTSWDDDLKDAFLRRIDNFIDLNKN